MKLRTALLPLAFATLVACKAPQPPAAPPAPNAPNQPAGAQTALGRIAEKAINEARTKLATENISLNGQYTFQHGTFKTDRDSTDTRPEAVITPQGDLLIAGQKVDVTPQQHAQLVQYRGHILAIAEAGMSIGVQGANMAGKAMKEAIAGVMSGKGDQIEQKMEAEGEKLRQQAKLLCARMSPMLQTQNELAASLPAFKPYATLTQADIDDCLKDSENGKGTARLDPAKRDQIRDEVRQQVREAIRDGVREAAGTQSSQP